MSARVMPFFAAPIVEAMIEGAPKGQIMMTLGASENLFVHNDRFGTAIDPDPLNLLALTVQLAGPPAADIGQAFTQLLDAPYRGRPWEQTLQRLYFTSCPACGRPTIALAYRWQGSPPALMARQVRCEHCGFAGEAAVETEDRQRAAEVEAGKALYWEMMQHAAEAADPLRSRLEQVAGFYTPRNLWGLWQSLRILQELRLGQDQRRALQWVLAQALWHGSSLEGQPEILWQSTARRPRRFIERNLWVVLHEALSRVQKLSGSLARPLGQPSYQLVQRWPEELKRRVEPESVGLALLTVPPSLPLYWLLRFAWSGWLFGRQAVAPMIDLLALRPGEWELLARRLGDAAKTITDWLAPGGQLAVQWRWRGDDDPSAAVLASLPLLSGPISVAAAGESEWAALAVAVKGETLPARGPTDLLAAGAEAMRALLSARGEPVTAQRLRPHILAAWRRLGDLPPPEVYEPDLEILLDPLAPPVGVQVLGGSGDAWEPGETAFWWLQDPPTDWLPTSDQVELAALEVLQAGPLPSTDHLAWQISLRLPPAATPDRPWIEALAASYCQMTADDLLILPQDRRDLRQAELAELAQALLATGQRMGFDIAGWPEDGVWTVVWQHGGKRRASFLLTATTALTSRIWRSRASLPGLARFLVLPGSRAELVQWRSEQQPLWAAAVAAGGWTFTKFRHLREMLADANEEPERWLVHLGLDPITSGHAEQMRLW